MERKITLKTPGKLMIAGEFAVLEPYQPLIVAAVDRYVTTTIERADKNSVTLIDFGLHQVAWHYSKGSVTFAFEDKRLSFIRDALKATLSYLEEQDMLLEPVSITITSELDDHASGLKYGLGSSAAVVTSVVAALLHYFLRKDIQDETIFKLAAMSHITTQGNGSGADVAASVYGGVLHYTSFQADWLKEEIEKTKRLTDLVEKEWTYLFIDRVQFPEDLQFCVGWTGLPASTGSLVDKILAFKSKKPNEFEQFLHDSHQAVNMIVKGMNENHPETFLKGIKKNRNALVTLAKEANVLLETEKLRILSDITEQFSGAGKLSGAGGGDCGIGFVDKGTPMNELHDSWRKHAIKPLDIRVSTFGSKVIKSE